MVEFTHRDTGFTFQKFGTTRSRDIMSRFDYTRYPERAGYAEFNIKPLFSMYTTDEHADALEIHFLSRYPKNFILEKETNKPYNYFNNRFTGITECVKLSNTQRYNILQTLFKLKK